MLLLVLEAGGKQTSGQQRYPWTSGLDLLPLVLGIGYLL